MYNRPHFIYSKSCTWYGPGVEASVAEISLHKMHKKGLFSKLIIEIKDGLGKRLSLFKNKGKTNLLKYHIQKNVFD